MGGKFQRRSASVLLLVLIVIALLTLASMALFERMFAEQRGVGMHGRRMQARGMAESGAEYAKVLLTQDPLTIFNVGGLYDNPEHLRGVLMNNSEVPSLRGRFTLVAPALNYDGYYEGVRYGLEDESSRWNLSTLPLLDEYQENAGRNALMRLPGMTEAIADAILDWVDEDEQPRPLGAELEYYSSLPVPYEPPNGPLETIEQLLLVRDVTPLLLFGADTNRNGIIEPAEEALAQERQIPVTYGRGWSAYLTVHSAEANVRPDGTPKIDINSSDLTELQNQLSAFLDDSQANFILAYRQNGPYDGDESGESAGSVSLDLEQEASTTISSLLELVGARTEVASSGSPGGQQGGQGGPGGDDQTIVEPSFPDDPMAMQSYLPTLFDNLTTSSEPAMPGRININHASRPVLEGLPGIDPLAVDQILDRRTLENDPNNSTRNYPAWLLVEGIMELDDMKRLMPLLNCGGDVFRVESVGFYDADGPAARMAVILDATEPVPTVRQWRYLDDLGPGYTLEILGGAVEPTE